jgi:hypothetical protein
VIEGLVHRLQEGVFVAGYLNVKATRLGVEIKALQAVSDDESLLVVASVDRNVQVVSLDARRVLKAELLDPASYLGRGIRWVPFVLPEK